jgi:hypothetical protein
VPTRVAAISVPQCLGLRDTNEEQRLLRRAGGGCGYAADQGDVRVAPQLDGEMCVLIRGPRTPPCARYERFLGLSRDARSFDGASRLGSIAPDDFVEEVDHAPCEDVLRGLRHLAIGFKGVLNDRGEHVRTAL